MEAGIVSRQLRLPQTVYCSVELAKLPLPAAGVPESELDMIQQQAAAAAQLPGTGAAADTAGAGAKEEEAAALMEPSEPVSAESIEDFQEAGGGGHRGLLQVRRGGGEEQGRICSTASSHRQRSFDTR